MKLPYDEHLLYKLPEWRELHFKFWQNLKDALFA